MPINAKCLRQLTLLGLPMNVDVKNKSGKTIATATINRDGTVSCSNGKKYDHPSWLRDDLISPNEATYKYLFYQGKSLTDHGVSQK